MAKLTKDGLVMDLQEILDAMNDEQTQALARTAIFQEEVIDGVVRCVLETYSYDGWWLDELTMIRIRERLVPHLPDAMRELAKDCIHRMRVAEAKEDQSRQWAWKLFHAWPKDYHRSRPDVPGSIDWPPSPTDAEANKILGIVPVAAPAPAEDVPW